MCQAANALTELGVRAGDKVAIYMPMIPETVVAMLACARLGRAAHRRLRRLLLRRAAQPHPRLRRPLRHHRRRRLPPGRAERRSSRRSTRPCRSAPTSAKVLVVRRTGQDVAVGRPTATCGGTTWSTASRRTHAAEAFDAEHPLYIMYTSGTTAKPKGILHTSGGYLTHVSATHRLIFDLKPETDVFWTAADIGWVTGHSYIVYGPLANGDDLGHVRGHARHAGPRPLVADRRALQGQHPLHRADDDPHVHEVGRGPPGGPRPVEPAPARARWASRSTPRPGSGTARHIGGDRCPIVDTWWQTETGGILITPLPGHHGHQARVRP